MHGKWSAAAADHPLARRQGDPVLDIVFAAITVAFFAVALAYVRGCDLL